MALNNGLSAGDRKTIAEGLARVLADSYTLYLKTHGYHWNVTGPSFPQLHTLFETQYQELALAVDEIAERIRALDHVAPASYRAFAALTSIEESGEKVPAAEEMLRVLAADNEAAARSARAAFPAAEEAGDAATADLLTRRLLAHEKAAWMLRASHS